VPADAVADLALHEGGQDGRLGPLPGLRVLLGGQRLGRDDEGREALTEGQGTEDVAGSGRQEARPGRRVHVLEKRSKGKETDRVVYELLDI